MNCLVKPIFELLNHFKHNGTSSINNCESLPEFLELLSNLEKVNCQDIGIDTSLLETYFKENTLTCIKVPTGSSVSIDVFCLPKGISLNMHDHPNMLVLTKVLYGSVHQRSLDLVDRSFQTSNQSPILEEDQFNTDNTKLLAILHADRILKAEEVFYLTPEKGNIHCFVAEENTILIDISFCESLYCNYYKEIHSPEKSEDEQHPEISQSTNDSSLALTEDHVSDSESESHTTKKMVTLVPILPPYDIRVRMLHYQGESLGLTA